MNKNLFGDPQSPTASRKKKDSSPVFKGYNQDQMMLLPPSLDELIPEGHMVRVVNDTIDKLNIEPLHETYKGGGTSAYHPLMLLKVLVYAYITKLYSVRQIAKALRENVYFMWLSGRNTPDFRTINNFRSGRLRGVIEDIFSSMVIFLHDNNYIKLEDYFIDGAKFGANANKHKVVWAKSTGRYKELALQRIKELLGYINALNVEEDKRYGDGDLSELGQESSLTSEEVKEQVEQLNEIIAKLTPKGEDSWSEDSTETRRGEEGEEKPSPSVKLIKRAVKKLKEKLLPKLERYEKQEELLRGRSSYSRTDPDATVFRTKSGDLIPAYNIIVGSQNQFIINYTFHQQKGSEGDGFIPHMRAYYERYCSYPLRAIADSAYGSEENYAFLDENKIGNYLKYSTYHQEQTNKHRTNPYTRDKFLYDEGADTYECPQGRKLVLKQVKEENTVNGYSRTLRVYQCEDCSGCPVAKQCKRGTGDRTIQVNRRLETYRAQARENLSSVRGKLLRILRNIDIESVFGDIKFNQMFSRFLLRGQEKVNIEFGLVGIAHNMKKMALWGA
jgi:transposase